MLSRAADSIYWMNRYLERVENYARFIDANLNLTLDLPAGMAEQWEPLVSTTGDNKLFYSLFEKPDRESVLRFLIEDERNPSSIRSALHRARENARSIREMLSHEIWEHVNDFAYQVRERLRTGMPDIMRDPLPFCTLIKQNCHLYAGLFEATLSHSEGWHFGTLGRQLERADQTTRLLDVKYFILLPRIEDIGNSFDLLQWSSVLKSASAYEMFTRIYDQVEPHDIIRFLLLDPEFPRSIRFCVLQASESLRRITGSAERAFANPAEKRLGSFRAQLDYTEVEDVFAAGLHEYLDLMQVRLNEIGEALHETYFRFEH